MTKFLAGIALIFLLTQNAFCKDYKIEELLQIVEKNSAVKSAEFMAISQRNYANQQKYWENPTLAFSRNSNQENFSVTQAVPFYGKLQSKYDIENS